MAAIEETVAEALRFSERDLRLRRTHAVTVKVIEAAYGTETTAGNAFVQRLAERVVAESPVHPLALFVRRQRVDRLLAAGDANAAVTLAETLYRDTTDQLGPDHPETIVSLGGLVGLAMQRRRPEALALAQRAVEQSTRVLGPDAPQTSHALLLLGAIHLREGHRAEAEEALSKALAAAKAFGEYSPGVAEVETEMARLALANDDRPTAIQRADRARAIFESNFGAFSGGRGRAYLVLADAQYGLGELAAAFDSASHAVDIFRADAGPDSQPVAHALLSRAQILAEGGDDARASESFERARSIFEARRALDHHALRALGHSAERLGRLDQSIAYLERATSLEEARVAGSPVATHLANSLAYSLAKAGHAERALSLAQDNLPRMAELYGSKHTAYAFALDTLGLALLQSGRSEQALEALDRARAIVLSVVAETAPMALELEENRAATLRALGREEESARILQRIAAAREVHAASLAQARAPESESLEFAVQNFRLASPGSPWIVQSPGSLGLDVDAFLTRHDPFMDFSVRTALTGAEVDPEEWLGRVEAHVRSGVEGYRAISNEPLDVAGIAGRVLRASYRGQNGIVYAEFWAGSHNGYQYLLQGRATGGDTPPSDVWQEVALVRQGFQLIDPTRRLPPSNQGFTYPSPRFGYSLDLTGEAWNPNPHKYDVPLAELGAGKDDVSIITVPVSDLGLEIEAEAQARALVAAVGLEQPGGFEAVDEPGIRGLEFRFTRERERRQLYRVRILRKGGVACLVSVAAYSEEDLAAVERFRWNETVKAPEPGDFSDEELKRHQVFLDELARHHALARRHADAFEVMQRRVGLAPDDVEFLEQLVAYQLAMGRYQDASRTVQEALELSRDRPALWAFRGRARHQLEGAAAAEADFRRALGLGFRDEAFLGEFADVLWELNRRDEAIEMLDVQVAESGARNLRLKRASLNREAGNLERAREELLELDEAGPGDADVLAELALVHYLAGDHRKSLVVCDRLLEQLPGSWEVLFLKAQVQWEAGMGADARTTIERAAAINANSEQIRELQRIIAGALGMGTTAGAQTPLEPVGVPEDLIDPAVDEAPSGSEDFGAYYAYWAEGVRYERDSRYRRTVRFRATIREVGGLEQFSNLTFEFNPLWERVFVNTLRVFDSSGKLIAEGDPSQYYVLDASDGSAGSERVLNVPVPGLAVGGTVEGTATIEAIHPPDRFHFVDFVFARTVPVARSVLYVEGDVADVRAIATSGSTRRDGEGWVAWIATQPEPYRWEPLQTADLAHLTRVRLSDARDDWERLALDYLESLGDLLKPSKATRALLNEAIAEGDQPADRVRRLAGLVQDRIRYEAVSFGPRARTPKAVEKTLSDGYGDCKDHSLLLAQLLQEAGFEARLALVNSSGAFERDAPSLDQFDHMLVWCGDCPQSGFIDTTDKHAELAVGPPRTLARRVALLLDPEKPRLETIGDPAPAAFAVEIEREIGLSSDGSLTVQEDVVLAGHVGAAIRSTLRSMDRTSWKEALLREVLTQDKALDVSAISAENVEEVDRPLRLSLCYGIEDAFTGTPDQLLGSLPSGWERVFLSSDAVNSRVSPFEVEPLQLTTTQRIELPPGFSVPATAPVGSGPGSRFLDWQIEYTPSSAGLVMKFRASRAGGRFAPKDYAGYYEETVRAKNLLDEPIQLRADH